MDHLNALNAWCYPGNIRSHSFVVALAVKRERLNFTVYDPCRIESSKYAPVAYPKIREWLQFGGSTP